MVAVHQPLQRTGDTAFLDDRVVCIADQPQPWSSAGTAEEFVSSAHCLLVRFPDPLTTVGTASGQTSQVRNLIVCLWRAHDASSDPIYWQYPEAFHFHRPRRQNADNRAHRHLGVAEGSASDILHWCPHDRSHQQPCGRDSHTRTHGGNARRDGPSGKVGREKERHSSGDGRSHRLHQRGDVHGAGNSRSCTVNSKRSTVTEVTGESGKRQLGTSLGNAAASADFPGRLAMPDTRAMLVSSNVDHAKTASIDSVPPAGAAKHTTDDQRAYKHICILILPFPFSVDPSEAAQQLSRSVEASTFDVLVRYNVHSHKRIRSTAWVSG